MKFFNKPVNVSALFAILIFLSVCSGAIAQEASTYKIIAISTDGNKRFDSKTIIANSGLKVGEEIVIPSDQTKDAIERLWNLNLFSDIQIMVDKKVGNGAYIVIKVKELPILDEIKYTGNDEFSKKDLDDKINLVKGQVITPQTVKDIEYNIKKAYLDEGYPLVEVSVDQFVNTYNEAQLRVKIHEGNKISVEKIRFVGNKKVSSSDLKGAMENTTERVWWKFWDKARFNKKDFEKDSSDIIDYYQEKGFKDASIESTSLKYTPDKEDVDITIKVNEGRRYRIGKITFTGNKIYKDSLLYERLGLKTGDVYNIKKFQQNLRGNENQTDISTLYLDNGYLNFHADVDETVRDSNIVDLNIKITEKNQFRVGLIGFSGNTKTQDKVMRRELFTLPGQYFNKSDMIRSVRQLSSLNYFNPEKFNYDVSLRNDSTVDLTYILEEKSSDQLNASVGYSESFGLSGSLGLTFNNFDISDPFSGGAGQVLSFTWDFGSGGTYRQFRISFTEPWFMNTPTLVGLDLFDTRTNYDYDIRETGATFNIGRRFKFPDDYFRGDWFLKYQETDVIQGAGIYQTGLRSQVSIGQVISRNSTDNPVFPTYGSHVAFSTEIAGANVIGSTHFLKLGFKSEAYNRIDNSGKFILASSFDIEGISSLAKDGYVPPNELFFMGGSGLAYNTTELRGYDDRTIGPTDIYKSPIGGRFLMRYSAELRYALVMDPIPVFLTSFIEAGNVWATFKQSNPFDLKRSAGFGIRVQLPAVGIIGFDLGYGFDRKTVDGQDPSWIFHFQFGKGF